MSNFRNLIETILIEYDRDDPTDNFWTAAKDTKRELKKNTLYTKTINPVKDTDPVYVKLIVRDENREKCIRKMLVALDEFVVDGIKTNIDLHRKILNNSIFRNGLVYTKFLEEHNVFEEE